MPEWGMIAGRAVLAIVGALAVAYGVIMFEKNMKRHEVFFAGDFVASGATLIVAAAVWHLQAPVGYRVGCGIFTVLLGLKWTGIMLVARGLAGQRWLAIGPAILTALCAIFFLAPGIGAFK